VESEEKKSHLAWLEEFLAPQFVLGADPEHDRHREPLGASQDGRSRGD
jgi:hypothetical protein